MPIYTQLNSATPIPTAVRKQIKSFLSSMPRFFEDFVASQGVPSREFTKLQWFEAAHKYGVQDTVLQMINGVYVNAPAGSEVETSDDMTDENEEPASPLSSKETSSAQNIAPAVVAGSFTMDQILGDARGFLAEKIIKDIEGKLAPVLAAANKPAEKIIQRVVEEVTQDPGGPAGHVPYARKGESLAFGKTFGLRSQKYGQSMVSIWDAQDAPPVDPYFVPDANIVAPIVSAMERTGVNVWLHGPAGTGKTSYPRYIAAKTNRPFVRIAFNRAVEPIDLFGCDGLDGNGGMAWRDGVLTKAIRRPGTVALLDEITFAPPGSLAGLQTLLDHRFVTLTSGEVVKCAEGVFFIVADNTAGVGDQTGVYSGTQTMNAALSDRFARMIRVDYMKADHETSALVNHTGATKTAAARVVDFMRLVRQKNAAAGSDAYPLSIRRSVAFIQCVQDGLPTKEAFSIAMLDRLPDAERTALETLFTTSFDLVAFDAEMQGLPTPDTSTAPEQQAARAAFDAVDGDLLA